MTRYKSRPAFRTRTVTHQVLHDTSGTYSLLDRRTRYLWALAQQLFWIWRWSPSWQTFSNSVLTFFDLAPPTQTCSSNSQARDLRGLVTIRARLGTAGLVFRHAHFIEMSRHIPPTYRTVRAEVMKKPGTTDEEPYRQPRSTAAAAGVPKLPNKKVLTILDAPNQATRCYLYPHRVSRVKELGGARKLPPRSYTTAIPYHEYSMQ